MRLLNHLVGITPEFTKGDQIVAWGGFFKHMVWDWCVAYAAQPLPADAALVFQRGAPDLRGKSKIKLSQISWWKMGDKPA